MSSSAKADDPVRRGVGDKSRNPGVLDTPPSRGTTTVCWAEPLSLCRLLRPGFDLAYGGGMFNNVSYEVVAQKVQADLGRVGIKVQLKPMNPANFRTIRSLGF